LTWHNFVAAPLPLGETVCVSTGSLRRGVLWERPVHVWSVRRWMLVLRGVDHYRWYHADWLGDQGQQVP